MYRDGPPTPLPDLEPQHPARGPFPLRATMLGGLVGSIVMIVVLIMTGVVAVGDDAAGPDIGSVIDSVGVPEETAGDEPAAEPEEEPAPVPERPVPTAGPNLPPAVAQPAPATMRVRPMESDAERGQRFRAELQEAVLRADRREMEAQRTLDEAPLEETYIGEQLAQERQAIQQMRQEGVYVDNRLVNVQWISFEVSPDEQRATVEVHETWAGRYHKVADGSCVARVPTHPVPQVVSLRKVHGAWKVESVTFMAESPEPVAC